MTTRRPQDNSDAAAHDDASRKHGLTESQSAYARPRRSEQAAADVDRDDGERGVPVRSDYRTRLGDVAVDAARDAAPPAPSMEAKP